VGIRGLASLVLLVEREGDAHRRTRGIRSENFRAREHLARLGSASVDVEQRAAGHQRLAAWFLAGQLHGAFSGLEPRSEAVEPVARAREQFPAARIPGC